MGDKGSSRVMEKEVQGDSWEAGPERSPNWSRKMKGFKRESEQQNKKRKEILDYLLCLHMWEMVHTLIRFVCGKWKLREWKNRTIKSNKTKIHRKNVIIVLHSTQRELGVNKL